MDLAPNLRSVIELRAENFVIVCNKCAPNFSVSKAIEFFYEAVYALEDDVRDSVPKITDEQVLLILEVNQKVIEKMIKP